MLHVCEGILYVREAMLRVREAMKDVDVCKTTVLCSVTRDERRVLHKNAGAARI